METLKSSLVVVVALLIVAPTVAGMDSATATLYDGGNASGTMGTYRHVFALA
jgi:hypothetical protein